MRVDSSSHDIKSARDEIHRSHFHSSSGASSFEFDLEREEDIESYRRDTCALRIFDGSIDVSSSDNMFDSESM